MIAPTPFFADRGCHVRILEEARILQQLGHRILVSTYHHGRDIDGIETARSATVPWYRKLAPGPSLHKFYVDWFLVSSTLQAARTFDPDIVHAHLHEGIFVGQFVKRRHRIPLVADLQGSLAGEIADHTSKSFSGIVHEVFGRAEIWLTAIPDHIISSSTGFAEVIRQRFGRKDVTVLADAVDVSRFRTRPGTGELRARLGIPRGRRVVVYLGVLTAYEGVDDLLEAAAIILRDRKDVHFLIMGYPDVETYQERAEALGIDNHVSLTGRIEYERAAEHLGVGDIAVSAKLSKNEANGKLLTYMACGLPTVVYESPINREILGDCGCYAPFGDQRSLADKIVELVNNRDQRLLLGKAVRQRATDRFPSTRTGQQLVELYRTLLVEGR